MKCSLFSLATNYWLTAINVLQFMKKYTKTKTIRLSEIQYNTLIKMQSYHIDIGKFIRDAISEKIKKEYNVLIPKPKKETCPF